MKYLICIVLVYISSYYTVQYMCVPEIMFLDMYVHVSNL